MRRAQPQERRRLQSRLGDTPASSVSSGPAVRGTVLDRYLVLQRIAHVSEPIQATTASESADEAIPQNFTFERAGLCTGLHSENLCCCAALRMLPSRRSCCGPGRRLPRDHPPKDWGRGRGVSQLGSTGRASPSLCLGDIARSSCSRAAPHHQ